MKIGLRNNSRLNLSPIAPKDKKGTGGAVDASSFLNSSNKKGERNYGVYGDSVSFTGLGSFVRKHASSLRSDGQKFFQKYMLGEDLIIKNYSNFVEQTNVFVGDGFIQSYVDDFQKLMGSGASRYVELSENTLKIHDRKLTGKLIEGVIDVAHLPIDIMGATIRGITKIPFIKNTRMAEALENIPFIKKRANKKAAMDIYYRLKGIAGYDNDVPALRKKILGVPAGDPVGNYNTKDERALNRLATGFVSSMFVGNDFYNLVMYEKNNKKEATKAGRKRRNREMLRIAINAFMTYSVLGALSSYVNGSIVKACAAIAGSSLFAEVATRVVTGVPLLPLSPEGAKKYNKKKAIKEQKKAQKGFFGLKNKDNADKNSASQAPSNNVQNNTGVNLNVSQNVIKPAISGNVTNMKANDELSNVFDRFRNPDNISANLLSDADASKWSGAFKGDNNSKKQYDKSNPITIKRVFIAMVMLLGGNLLYHRARTKIPAFNEMILNAQKAMKKTYKELTTTDLIVGEAELRKFLSGFKDTHTESIQQAYSRTLDVCFTKKEAEKLLKGARDGVIEIDRFNPIYNKAYIRTAERNLDNLNINTNKTALSALKKLRQEASILAKTPEEVPKPGATDIKKIPHHFVKAKFRIDLSQPVSVVNGEKYYRMIDSEFNFGRIKETKYKVLIDALIYPFKAMKTIVNIPIKPVKMLARKRVVPVKPEEAKKVKKKKELAFDMPDLGELYRDCSAMFKRYQKGSITKEEFRKYMGKVNTRPLNTDTVPRYPQASLASVSRNFVALISSYFFVNDFRNEILIQSNGENTEKASEVTKERSAHKLSNFILNKFFMELFNNTFNKQLLGSLAGATAVAAATEVTNESSVRLSIGVPLGKKNSREEIDEFEKNHLEQKGIRGAYYRTMARITGKKMLSEKAENK